MPYTEKRGTLWRVKWWAGEYLDNGKKKYESESGFESETDAYEYGLDREYEFRHDKRVPKSRGDILMKDYTLPLWLPDQDLRPESVKTYRSMINAQINRQWGRRRIGDLTTPEYITWKNALNQKVEAKKLSRTYVDDILMVFAMMMGDAVTRYKFLTESPVPPPTPRRGRYRKKTTTRKKQPLAMGPVYQLAVNAYTVWGYTGWVYIWHASFQGNRPGEMYGLQKIYSSPAWPAADPDAAQRQNSLGRYGEMPATRTEYQLQWVEGKKTLTPPKYDSHRTLVEAPFLTEMHTALATSHASRWTFPAMHGGDLLGARFDRDYWGPIRDGSLERDARKDFMRPAIPPVKEFSVEGWPIYRLRHWMRECLEEDGHSQTAIETRMGHDLAGVRGLYSNLTVKMERDIVESQQERWEAFHRAAGGLWVPPFPSSLPNDQPVPQDRQVKAGISRVA